MYTKVYTKDEFYTLLAKNPMEAKVSYSKRMSAEDNSLVIILDMITPMGNYENQSLYKVELQLNYTHREENMERRYEFLRYLQKIGLQTTFFPYYDDEESVYVFRGTTEVIFKDLMGEVMLDEF